MAAKTPDTFTTNGAPAYSSTGQRVLDLFFSGLVRGADEAKLFNMMPASWDESPEQTIRVLQHARDCRGGKGEKLVVEKCLKWLRQHKPKTYEANLRYFLEVGCYKDLLKMCVEADSANQEKLGEKDLLELEVMAEALKKDLAAVEEWEKSTDEKKGKTCPVSLVSKWAPNEKGSFDKKGKLAKRLAKVIFADDSHACAKYRKMVGSLRNHMMLVERLMCNGRWDDINFGAVPSRAQLKLKGAFRKHNEERYQKYLDDVSSGKEKINTQGVMIHELVKSCMRGQGDDTTEVQYKDILNKLRKAQEDGTTQLGAAVAVCDVSGSMSGIPMEVCIALGILMSQLTDDPWKRRILTFSEQPQWHTIEGEKLADMVSNLQRAKWGMSTNLLACFGLILEAAKTYSLTQEQLPKSLFIFSDMQFDSAVGNSSRQNTTFQEAKRMFSEAGYVAPNVVFWNLQGNTTSMPVKVDENGVTLCSGFSQDLLKLFMADGEFTPLTIMEKAVEKYPCSICESERE